MENLRINFTKIYNELLKTIKVTKIAHGMGFKTTRQLYNTLDGKAMLSTKATVNLIKNFNINPIFLFNGIGKIYINKTQCNKNQVDIFKYTFVNSTM